MQRYSSYITRQLAHSTVLVALSLTSIVWLTQALRLMDIIVNQGVGLQIFLLLTMLLVPSMLLFILPIALFCAVVFIYHKLKADSELIALQSAGLSRMQLAKPLAVVALAVVLFGYLISLYLLPLTYARFRELQLFLRHNYVSVVLQEGVFSSPIDGLTVFIREREDDGRMQGILVHDNRTEGAAITMLAEEGRLVDTDTGPRFLLTKGNRQEMRDGQLSFLTFDSYPLDLSLYASDMAGRLPDPQEMYLSQLWAEPEANVPAAQVSKRVAEGHQRLIWPLYNPVFAMLGLAMVLSGQFSRRGSWQRTAIGISAAATLLFLAVALRNMTAQNNMMIPLAYAALVIPGWAAWQGLRERAPSRGRQRWKGQMAK